MFVGWYNGETRIEFPYTTTINATFEAKYYDLTKGSLISADIIEVLDGEDVIGYKLNSYANTDATCYIPSIFVDGDTEKNIISINLSAFAGSNVTQLVIPNGVLELTGSLSASSIVKVTIPSTVKTISTDAFTDIASLEIIWEENSELISADLSAFTGTKWFTDESNKARLGANNGFVVAGRMAIKFVGITAETNKVALIPSNIIKLNDNMFLDNTTLTSVTINDALKYIGDDCFKGAINIENIVYETIAANSDLVNADIDAIGIKDTKWYKNQNKVILGTIFVKYKDNFGAETVSIPDYITKISKNALLQAQAKQIIFEGNNVVEIGDYAFKESKLTSFILPSSVAILGKGIFSDCVDLLSFDGSNSNANLSVLPNEMFINCVNLETVNLGNGFKSLSIDNFQNCSKLDNITANGINIDTDIQLSDILDTPYANKEVTSDDQHIIIGSIYLKYIQGTTPNRGTDNLIIADVPENVTIIYKKAFFAKNQIGKVNLPASLLEIKNEAFKDCTSLYQVVITGEVLKNIDISAFENTSLEEILLPNGLINIGDMAFKNSKLIDVIIPNSVTNIGQEAFASVDGLKSVTLGKGINYIGSSAFADNASLIKVNWALEKLNVKINDNDEITIKQLYNLDNALKDDTNYTSDKVAYLNGIFDRAGSIAIRMYIPSEAYNILEVTVLDHLTNWNDIAFTSMDIYLEGDLPQVSFDGEGYIMEAFNAEIIEDADVLGVPTRADHTFMGWYEDETYTTMITYPYNVNVDITIYAKWYNNNWDNDHDENDILTYSLVNNKYTITGWGATDEATPNLFIPNKVNNIIVDTIDIISGDQAKADVVTKIIFTQASNFANIDTNIFKIFTNLEEVILCDSNINNVLYKVENGAMYSIDDKVLIAYFKQYVTDEEGTRNLVTTFDIPQNVEVIMPYAFVNSGLTTINIPNTVTTIGENAFNDNMADINFAEDIDLIEADKESFNNTHWYQNSAYEYYTVNNSNVGTFYSAANVLLEYYEVAAPSLLTLPNTMGGFDITVLASNMYTRIDDNYERDPYDNVILPAKLERINEEAFAMKDAPLDGNIHWLDSINFDGESCSNTLTYIANDVFSKVKYYTEYHNVDLLILGKILLRYLNTASTLNITGESIETIAKGAFKASKLVNIYLPNSLKIISDEAFSGSSDLVSITIPQNVTEVGNKAFLNCQSLTEVTFAGEKITKMGNQIFSGCYHIPELFIPYTVKEIGSGAFESCSDLKNIYFDKPIYVQDPDTGKMVVDGWSSKSQLTILGQQAFEECISLSEIKIPNGISKIATKTFAGCSSLINANFETDKSMVKTIEYQAFKDCIKLGSIIDVDNPSLITLKLPNRLVTVQDEAFYGCTGLYGVLFNYNIASLGYNVFGACRYLAKIEISSGNAPTITENTFLRKYDVIEPYYALRIYVGDDDVIYNDFTNDWNSANNGDNSFTLCKKSDPKPSLIYSYRKDTGGSVITDAYAVPINIRKDVYINPTYIFNNETITEWTFIRVNNEVVDSRIGKTLGNVTNMAYTRQYNEKTAQYDYILVMDYEIKLENNI